MVAQQALELIADFALPDHAAASEVLILLAGFARSAFVAHFAVAATVPQPTAIPVQSRELVVARFDAVVLNLRFAEQDRTIQVPPTPR